ncbi:hypothetical protein [Paludibaculum fermentans]|uniref:hypothetical protein n=1 Tax=Paludibaculum fermentans TaxID=1473598 RepID=UPI003EBF314A
MQRLRGRIAVEEGALRASQLTADGRDASSTDALSWHLLSLGDGGAVEGCVRMLVHPRQTKFENLNVSHTKMAACPECGIKLRSAVEADMRAAQTAGAMVVEVGGWVLSERMRGTAEAVRLALGVWAWGRLLGGAMGIATATTRNHSAYILGRIGGRPLQYRGETIPKYFEPKYNCDIQILRFESDSYSDRFAPIVDSMTSELIESTVVSSSPRGIRFLPSIGAGVHFPHPEPAFAGLAN